MKRSLPFDPARLMDAVLRSWRSVGLASVSLAAMGFWAAYSTAPCSVALKLMRNQPPSSLKEDAVSQGPATHNRAARTLLELMQGPAIWRRAASAAGLADAPEPTAYPCQVSEVAGTDLVLLRMRGRDATQTVGLINAYAQEAVHAFRELQFQEAEQTSRLLQDKLAAVDAQLGQVNQDLARLQRIAGVISPSQSALEPWVQKADLDRKTEDLKAELETVDLQLKSLTQEVIRQSPALIAAKEALGQALQRYTEEHPKVKELRASMASLEAQVARQETPTDWAVATGGNSLVNSLLLQVVELRTRRINLQQQLKHLGTVRDRWHQEMEQLPQWNLDYSRAVSQAASLNSLRAQLVSRQQEVQLLADHALGSYRVIESASLADISRLPKLKAGLQWGFGMGVLGFFIISAILMLVEAADGRIRTRTDLARVSGLPVLAELGDLQRMSESEQDEWAFRTLLKLKGQLHMANPETMVCGFTSSSHGEGRSTWIRLLAKAAHKQGYHVLALSGSHTHGKLAWHPDSSDSANPGQSLTTETSSCAAHDQKPPSLAELPAMPVPISDGIWNLECRQRWHEVLRRWSHVPNLAVFVELPPANDAQGVLMSDGQWPLIWLCGQDMARAGETRTQLETLRHTRCQLIGTVFNRAAIAPWRRHIQRLARSSVLLTSLLTSILASQLSAQNTQPEGANSTPSMAATPVLSEPTTQVTNQVLASSMTPSNRVSSLRFNSPSELADWQKRLTLGPGDTISISLIEQEDTIRPGVTIGPDGRINYLQARDFEATGLTIDELRAKLENVLSKYYLAPRVVVHPEAYRSKSYIVLGNVNQKGVFPLDRPVTIVDAVARSKGFESSYQHRNALVLADLTRSFLMRKSDDGTFKQVPVDFEALFLRGDFSQNIGLAPGDYLYFPPLDTSEVYGPEKLTPPALLLLLLT